MKSILHVGCRAALVALALLISSNLHSQENTEGTLTFTIETMSNGGNYAPKHVLAIWIEDESGFVKTRKRRAEKRKQYLYTWRNRSSENTVDAITGETLKEHQLHTITWDGTDVDGNVVPDGNYKVWVEFTDAHAQGPLYSLAFAKGTEEVSLSPANSGKFKNISLLWEPDVIPLPEADFSYNSDELTVTFVNHSLNADSYSWNFGDSQTSNEENPVHTYAEAGSYQVVLVATGPGGLSSTEAGITVSKTALPEVVADFNFTASDLEVTFVNTSSNAESFSWDFGDTHTSTDADPVHTYAEEGTYQVVLEASTGEVTDTTTQDVSVTAAATFVVEKEGILKVFPNPATGKLILENSSAIPLETYTIVGMDGRQMQHGAITGAAQFVISLGQVERGTYVLMLEGTGKKYSIPFVKK